MTDFFFDTYVGAHFSGMSRPNSLHISTCAPTNGLMTFNFLIENKDDHAKNFSFMFKDGGWHLTPAFDLLPSEGFNGFHTTTINDSVTPTERDIIDVADKVGLQTSKAKDILAEMKDVIKRKH